uniref:Uncharacterized protein n=1 Tax=Vibrio parahaemolyticus TaxID=670 RepID=A0A1Y1BFG0_VIBPH|nr:hypothetical protein [Vibrio parahaemolyticus]
MVAKFTYRLQVMNKKRGRAIKRIIQSPHDSATMRDLTQTQTTLF